MNEIQGRLERLRQAMKANGADAYLVETADFHQSEYVGAYFKSREYLSGFTGSAGTLLVMEQEALLWTDGRYFVQAARELEGSGIKLMRSGEEGVPEPMEYLEENLPAGGYIGFDGRTVNAAWGEKAAARLEKKQIRFLGELDLAGEVWENRPPLSANPAWALDVQYAGVEAAQKLQNLREQMKKAGAGVHILTSLDDIAWLLNLRGDDVRNNPVALAYLMVRMDGAKLFVNRKILQGKAYLYMDNIQKTTEAYLQELGIEICPYQDFYQSAGQLQGETILLEKEKVNFALWGCVSGNNRIIDRMNPTSVSKAVKNPVEQENMRQAHLKDGTAVTRFIYWLKHEGCAGTAAAGYGAASENGGGQLSGCLDEVGAAKKLEEFRKEQEGYLGPSFNTISAYGANAAMCHYHAAEGNCAVLKPEGFYLVDSGGQYYQGTTDITRTIALGPLTDEQKKHFTLVLASMLRLGAAKFLYGCRGLTLDYVAREPLWNYGLDFNHGTGHGVGYLLNVHERPNRISFRIKTDLKENAVLEEGMVTSDEPGIYIEGSHGIRTENLILCRKDEKNQFGQFMRFEYLTWVPIDLEAVDLEYLSERDVELLNEYHRQVYEKIGPRLPEKERQWLREATAAVSKN